MTVEATPSVTPIADLADAMAAKGGTLEVILVALRTLELSMATSKPVSVSSADTAADIRRERDRLRKQAARKKAKENNAEPQKNDAGSGPVDGADMSAKRPQDNADTEDLLGIYNKKKDSRSREVEVTERIEKKESKSVSARVGTVQVVSSDWPADYRERFWGTYPRKVEKQKTMSILDRLQKRGTVSWAVFFAGVERYAVKMRGTEPKYVKHPPTWLNAGCWDDEVERGGGRDIFGHRDDRQSQRPMGFAELRGAIRNVE